MADEVDDRRVQTHERSRPPKVLEAAHHLVPLLDVPVPPLDRVVVETEAEPPADYGNAEHEPRYPVEVAVEGPLEGPQRSLKKVTLRSFGGSWRSRSKTARTWLPTRFFKRSKKSLYALRPLLL